MYVINRHGQSKPFQVDKITCKLKTLCKGLDMKYIDLLTIAEKASNRIYPGVTTTVLNNFIAEIIASMILRHPDYSILAGRIKVFNLHKETKSLFSEVMNDLYEANLIDEFYLNIILKNKNLLDLAINYENDYNYTYMGFKILEHSYLLRINDKIVERPQHMIMRVAVGIHGSDLPAVLETYHLMSNKWFTHASTTILNAATINQQLSSCFLLTVKENSVEGIFDTLKQCAIISKYTGGIGLSIQKVSAKGNSAGGLVPIIKIFNDTAQCVSQGNNKRPGAFALYLEPWHADIMDFLKLRRNVGIEEQRARDLFYGLWIPDIFMERVLNNQKWSLMCPNECPNILDKWGKDFEQQYIKYENEHSYREQINARTVWREILISQIETGTPYMLFKDSCNRKSNQLNLGTINCSNLCTEIIQYSSHDEIAVCNLASIAVNKCVVITGDEHLKPHYDFNKLMEITRVVTKNLNKIIDINYYPLKEATRSNLRHRPIGIGIQGLADAFILMRYPFDSDDAKILNRQIFETIYYAAMETSCDLARYSGPYETYDGSPLSKGIFQYDQWPGIIPTELHNWTVLKNKVARFGVRNSLLIAPMPTATSAQILGNNESIEPYTSNMYLRRVLSGEFQIVNQHMIHDLIKIGLWNEDLKNKIIANNGSIQNIEEIPENLKKLYKTVWEISQRVIIDLAADRAPFIDQNQSLNIHIAKPTFLKLSSLHFYAWKKGLKSSMYYFRTKPATNATQFTIEPTDIEKCATSEECLSCQA